MTFLSQKKIVFFWPKFIIQLIRITLTMMKCNIEHHFLELFVALVSEMVAHPYTSGVTQCDKSWCHPMDLLQYQTMQNP